MNISDLTLAYELHCEGICWKTIARHLGVNARTLQNAISSAVCEGIGKQSMQTYHYPSRCRSFGSTG